MVMKNTMTVVETEMYHPFVPIEGQEMEKEFNDLPMWLLEDKAWGFISGENSILNTMKLLDIFGVSMNFEGRENHGVANMMARMWNQPEWDETKNPASSIRG